MVDRTAFRRLNPNHILPVPVPPKVDDVAGAASDPRFTQAQYDEFGNFIPVPLPVIPSRNISYFLTMKNIDVSHHRYPGSTVH